MAGAMPPALASARSRALAARIAAARARTAAAMARMARVRVAASARRRATAASRAPRPIALICAAKLEAGKLAPASSIGDPYAQTEPYLAGLRKGGLAAMRAGPPWTERGAA